MRLRDRYTGLYIEGEFEYADDYGYAICPVCGADDRSQCSVPDPDRDGFGIELGAYIHRERAIAWEEQEEAPPNT